MKVFLPGRGRAKNKELLTEDMSLLGHLQELRSRLFKVVAAYVLAAIAGWFLYSTILELLIGPLSRLPVADQILQGGNLIYTAPTEALFIRLKVTAFAGLIFSLPVIFWHLWRFVTPGLHAHERRYALSFVFASVVLFALGMATAFVSLPKALEVLAGFTGGEMVLLPRASEYLSFVMLLIAAFGFSFEFPLILLGLTLVGVVSSSQLRQWRRIAWVVILLVAAVITPTQDPVTLAIMAVPLGLLYEATVLVARLMKG